MKQIKGESEKDYILFLEYLEMQDRSIAQFAILKRTSIKKIKTLSELYSWEERAKEYDQQRIDAYKEKKQALLNEIVLNETESLSKINKLAIKLLEDNLLKHLEESFNSKKAINFRDLEKLKGLISIKESNNDDNKNINLESLTKEEIEEINKVLEKIEE